MGEGFGGESDGLSGRAGGGGGGGVGCCEVGGGAGR